MLEWLVVLWSSQHLTKRLEGFVCLLFVKCLSRILPIYTITHIYTYLNSIVSVVWTVVGRAVCSVCTGVHTSWWTSDSSTSLIHQLAHGKILTTPTEKQEKKTGLKQFLQNYTSWKTMLMKLALALAVSRLTVCINCPLACYQCLNSGYKINAS